MSVDDFVKLSLALAISLSIFGISIQIMRLLGTLNGTLSDFRSVTHQIAELLRKIVADYEDIVKAVKGITKPLQAINKHFLMPLTELAAVAGGVATNLKQRLVGKA